MKRRFRLTRSIDIKRVRDSGKSFAHPLLVLVKLPSAEKGPRVGFVTTRTVGNAVQRNRARRLMREAARVALPVISSAWDLVLVARNRMLTATFLDVQGALDVLIRRADIMEPTHIPEKQEHGEHVP